MHEIGVLIEVVKTVENFAKQNGVKKIQVLVLQIGELSSMIPRYIEACYPAAVDGTILQETELKIEILPGNAICITCNKVFNLVENKRQNLFYIIFILLSRLRVLLIFFVLISSITHK